MYRFHTFLSLTLIWLLSACSSPAPTPDLTDKGSDYPTDETFDLIDRSMSYMTSDPARAHLLLDSIADAGLMTRQRCAYYHAMVVFSGEHQLDAALVMCDSLLDMEDFGDDRFLEEELCVLASNITSGSKSHLSTLKYANRGIALCHGDERMRGDEVTLMARVGMAEQGLGRLEQARETFDRAYQLLKATNTFADLVALISLQKKQIGLYNELREYDTTISTLHEIEQLVDHFRRDPSFVAQRPATMQEPGEATRDFANFYRSQVYAQLARAFRLRIEQGLATDVKAETDSVRLYMQKLQYTEGAQNTLSWIYAMREMRFLGLKAEFDRTRPQAEELYQSDSLVEEYVDYLTLLADDAASAHDLQASNGYLRRAMAINDSINQHELMRMLTEQMSINMVQEQHLARQDAENELKRHKLMNLLLTIVLIILLAAGLITHWLWRKNQKKEEIIKMAQQDLEETQEEVKELTLQLERTKEERNTDNMQTLYERIEKLMKEEKLFMNEDLDVKMLADAANSSRPAVSSCINKITGKPFRQWLSEYRLSLIEKMLVESPDIPIDEIAAYCGYKDQSTFRRQFKEKHGITALQYRRNIFEQGGL